MLEERLYDSQEIVDLLCQKLPVLIADLFRRALKMNIDPAITLETVASFQTVVFRRTRFPLDGPKSADTK